MVWWLGLRAFIAIGQGLIPGWGTKILQAVWHGQKKKLLAILDWWGGSRKVCKLAEPYKGLEARVNKGCISKLVEQFHGSRRLLGEMIGD